jgi:hypothetical protein
MDLENLAIELRAVLSPEARARIKPIAERAVKAAVELCEVGMREIQPTSEATSELYTTLAAFRGAFESGTVEKFFSNMDDAVLSAAEISDEVK